MFRLCSIITLCSVYYRAISKQMTMVLISFMSESNRPVQKKPQIEHAKWLNTNWFWFYVWLQGWSKCLEVFTAFPFKTMIAIWILCTVISNFVRMSNIICALNANEINSFYCNEKSIFSSVLMLDYYRGRCWIRSFNLFVHLIFFSGICFAFGCCCFNFHSHFIFTGRPLINFEWDQFGTADFHRIEWFCKQWSEQYGQCAWNWSIFVFLSQYSTNIGMECEMWHVGWRTHTLTHTHTHISQYERSK